MKTLLDVSVFIFVWYSASSQLYDLANDNTMQLSSNLVQHKAAIQPRPRHITTPRMIKYFEIPEATFKLLKPFGFSVSIPGNKYIYRVEFHVNVNKRFDNPLAERGMLCLEAYNHFCKSEPMIVTNETHKFKDFDKVYYFYKLFLIDNIIVRNDVKKFRIIRYNNYDVSMIKIKVRKRSKVKKRKNHEIISSFNSENSV